MKTPKAFVAWIALGSLSLVGGWVAAQNPAPKSVSAFDRDFVTKATQAGIAEVKEGQVAVKHGGSQAVKDFGQKMIDDHTKAGDALKSIAQSKGITVPTQPDAAQQTKLDSLDKLTGATFDTTYVKGEKTDHLQAIHLFESEIKKGSDPDLKAFAGKTLPMLQEHYKMLQKIKPGTKM